MPELRNDGSVEGLERRGLNVAGAVLDGLRVPGNRGRDVSPRHFDAVEIRHESVVVLHLERQVCSDARLAASKSIRTYNEVLLAACMAACTFVATELTKTELLPVPVNGNALHREAAVGRVAHQVEGGIESRLCPGSGEEFQIGAAVVLESNQRNVIIARGGERHGAEGVAGAAQAVVGEGLPVDGARESVVAVHAESPGAGTRDVNAARGLRHEAVVFSADRHSRERAVAGGKLPAAAGVHVVDDGGRLTGRPTLVRHGVDHRLGLSYAADAAEVRLVIGDRKAGNHADETQARRPRCPARIAEPRLRPRRAEAVARGSVIAGRRPGIDQCGLRHRLPRAVGDVRIERGKRGAERLDDIVVVVQQRQVLPRLGEIKIGVQFLGGIGLAQSRSAKDDSRLVRPETHGRERPGLRLPPVSYWSFQPVRSIACWLFGLQISSQSEWLPDESVIPTPLSARISLMMGLTESNCRSSRGSRASRRAKGALPRAAAPSTHRRPRDQIPERAARRACHVALLVATTC